MTYHVCLGCENVWFGGASDKTEHEDCHECRPGIREAIVREVAERRWAEIKRAHERIHKPAEIGRWIPVEDPEQAGGDISRLLWVLRQLGVPGSEAL